MDDINLLEILKKDMSYLIDNDSILFYLYDFPTDWKTQDIYNNLCKLMPFKIKWLDDNSCFIKVLKDKSVICFENCKILSLENEITIKNYLEWKKSYIPKNIPKKEYIKNPQQKYFERIKKEIKIIKTTIIPTVVKNINISDNEKSLRTINGILNKFSQVNFEKLSNKIIDIIELEECLIHEIVNIIYKKAIDQIGFIILYVNLCEKLCKFKEFKIILIKKCEIEFNKDNRWTNVDTCDSITLNENDENSIELKREIHKRNVLGNIYFISNLYLINFISDFTIENYINSLMNNINEENIEILCKLIKVIKIKFNCKIYLNKMIEISENLKPRLKILINDLI